MASKSIKQKFPLSPWFFKRVGIAIIATGLLALYFFYDGAIGYPKKNVKAEMYKAFMVGLNGADLGIDSPKPDVLAAYEDGKAGGSWAGFTAKRNLPSKKPKKYTDTQIRNQFIYGAILALTCLATIGWLLLMRKRQFLLHESSFSLPTGQTVNFSDVQSIDLNKWDRGVAKVVFKSDDKNVEVKVDEYKYAGAGAILRQIHETFPKVEILGDLKWLTQPADSDS